MLRNYLIIALRNVSRHKGYTVINVAGLAIGIACCLVILGFVLDETRYDRFHTHADRIYRIVYSTSNDGQPTNANTSFSVGPALETEFPAIEKSTRFVKMGWGEKRVFSRGDRRFYEGSFFFADASVFDVFTFPLLDGNRSSALVEPQSIVLTESAAQKYFGEENPVGRTISVDAFNDGSFAEYRVTGVLQDLPRRSHIQFDFLLSFSSLPGPPEGWGLDPVFNYVLLSEGVDPSDLESRFPHFLDRQLEHFGHERYFDVLLQPITDIHLHSQLRAELRPNGNVAYVYIFSAIAFFILLIACVNFMNLATARSARRAKEVGLRKVAGANRAQLIRQFLSEAILLSVLSAILAIGVVRVLLPAFNQVAGTALSFSDLTSPPIIGLFVALTLLVGLLAGSYPAIFLSAFQPSTILKGTMEGGEPRAALIRKGLVVFQFGVSILLIACTAVVSQQMDYVRDTNLGFDREHVVVLPLNDQIRQSYSAFRRELSGRSGIRSVSLSEQVPARAGNGASYLFEGMDEDVGVHRLFVDERFTETYGVEMAAGRSFSRAISTDSSQAFLVNETLVREAGWESAEAAIGKEVTMYWSDVERRGRIVGVTRDFHLFSLRGAVTPVVINQMPYRYLNFASVRLGAASGRNALRQLGTLWAEFAPDYPFEYYFVDDDFQRLHRADQQLGQVFTSFAALAMLIACLGLFALASFTTEQRTKEIGVRKVLGASVPQVVALLTRDFTRLIMVAFLIAAPAAYVLMQRWLEDFVYRIDLQLWTFAAAGIAALFVAWATVAYQTFRAANTDPVRALRYE